MYINSTIFVDLKKKIMSLPGETEIENRPSTESKALRINLNSLIYGTFAEIGAGQEVARQFFRIGGASGTIAKTISAYDKTFSDNIYGEEVDKRYVTEGRVDKMLDHEIDLLETRIRKKNPQKMFFHICKYSSNHRFCEKI